MNTARSRLTFIVMLAASLGLMSMAGAAPAPPNLPGRPKLRLCFEADPRCIRSMEFTPDGKKVLSLGGDLAAKLWNVSTGKQIAVFRGHGRPQAGRLGTIPFMALSPDGKTFASSGNDATVRFWDVATGKNVANLRQLHCSPLRLLFSRNGKTFFSLGQNSCSYLWDLETKKERVVLDELLTNGLLAVALDTSGKPLVLTYVRPAVGDPPTFHLWTSDSAKHPAVTFRVPPQSRAARRAATAAFSPDCKTIASAHLDGSVRLWNAATGQQTAAFPKLPGGPQSLAFSPDGKVLAVGYQPPPPQRDEKSPFPPPCVSLYEVARGKLLATLTGDPGVSGPLVFSPDGRTLATTAEGPPPPRGSERRESGAPWDGAGKIMLWSLPARYAPPK